MLHVHKSGGRFMIRGCLGEYISRIDHSLALRAMVFWVGLSQFRRGSHPRGVFWNALCQKLSGCQAGPTLQPSPVSETQKGTQISNIPLKHLNPLPNFSSVLKYHHQIPHYQPSPPFNLQTRPTHSRYSSPLRLHFCPRLVSVFIHTGCLLS